jgi:hypothetical protein
MITKVNNTAIFWQTIAGKLLMSLRQHANKKTREETHSFNRNIFPAWPRQHSLGSFAFDLKEAKVSHQALEQFIHQFAHEKISYQGFLSSELDQIKKAMAVQKMMALINDTVAEMKMIELNHIAHSKV